MDVIPDQHYIDKVLAGENEAFTDLVERYKHMAYTLAFRLLKNHEEAEETAQDAFVKAYQHLRAFRSESKFSTWLYKIIYHSALGRLRKVKREYRDLDDFEKIAEPETGSILQKLKIQDQKKYLTMALENLDPEENMIIHLYYLNESPISEVCAITGLSESNVKIKLFRIRKKLYQHLTKLLKQEITNLI